MKGFKMFLLIFIVMQCGEGKYLENEEKLLSKALSDVLQFLSIKEISQVNVYYDRMNNFDEIIENILKVHDSSLTFKIHSKIGGINFTSLVEPTIALFKSLNSLSDFFLKVYLNDIYRPNFYFIYCQNVSENLLLRMDTFLRDYLVLMVPDGDSLKLFTLKDSTEDACMKLQIVQLNVLSRNLLWNKTLDFPDKFRNFHQCPLVIRIVNRTMFSTFKYRDETERSFDITGGILIDFVTSLAQHFNYTIIFNPYNQQTQKSFYDKNFPLHLHLFYKAMSVMKPYQAFEPMMYFGIGFIVPDGEIFSNFEKLFLPFSMELWIALGILFLISFIVVYCIKRSSNIWQTTLFGKNVKTPSLNIFIAIFGGSQTVVPKTSFARTVLIIFIFFCLIIRTAYQALLFNRLQGDPRDKRVETFQDLIDKKFSLIISPYYYRDEYEFLKQTKVMIVNKNKIGKYYEKSLNASYRIGILGDTISVFDLNFLYETQNFRITKEKLWIESIGLLHQDRKYLNEVLNSKIPSLRESGILDHWIQMNLINRRSSSIEGPKVLTMQHLKIGFELFICFLILSFITFTVEQCSRLKYYVIFKGIWNAYENMRSQ